MEEIQFGFGLNGMKERLEPYHGTLSVHSGSGQGTFVICNILLQTEQVHGAYETRDGDSGASVKRAALQVDCRQAIFIGGNDPQLLLESLLEV